MAVRDSVGQFIQDRPNDRIGMVVFAGEAFLMSPLTLDHGYYKVVLNATDTDTISEEGTDIAAALREGVQKLLRSSNFRVNDLRLMQAAQRTVVAGSARLAFFAIRMFDEVRQQPAHRGICGRGGVAGADSGERFERV